MEFSGRLTAFPLGDLLQWAKNDRCTGALVIRRSEREKRIYFHAGDVVGCLSNDPAEFYGQHLVLHGHLGDDQLFQALSHCATRSVRLGVALRELGLLPPRSSSRPCASRSRTSICDLFLWQRGIFYFQAELPPGGGDPARADQRPGAGDGGGPLAGRGRPHPPRAGRTTTWCSARGERWPGGGPARRSSGGSSSWWTVERTLGELYKKVRGSYFRFLEAAFRLCVGSGAGHRGGAGRGRARHARDERLRPAAGAGHGGAGAGGPPAHGGAARPAGALLSRSGSRSRRRRSRRACRPGRATSTPASTAGRRWARPSPATPRSAAGRWTSCCSSSRKGRLALLPAPVEQPREQAGAARPAGPPALVAAGVPAGLVRHGLH